ncbi:hypothetical protein [Marinicella meishanensis]|uniref:hypothetical protein n=1 Tax=Marinicella meishanensis TaxID=2873263 RepID=UPI001CBEF00F|nr:hypothetical protein [Marinicella sp. NBU2979]
MKLSQVILSNMPNGRSPLSWVVFILILLVMIPILIVLVILLPLVLIFNLIKMRFFPSKTPKTFVTPFGFAQYSQANQSVVNYPWHDVDQVEVWNEAGKTFGVLIMKSGEPVKLPGVSIEQLKALCAQHGIAFHETVVVVQEVE